MLRARKSHFFQPLCVLGSLSRLSPSLPHSSSWKTLTYPPKPNSDVPSPETFPAALWHNWFFPLVPKPPRTFF